MSKNPLSQFVSALESEGELIRVKEFISPRLEMTEITDRIVKNNGKALLFENNGTEFPVLINALASEKRICMALGMNNLEEAGAGIDALLKKLLSPDKSFIDKVKILPTLQKVSSWMPKVIRGKGNCQEVVMSPPDLSKLPVMTCWPEDGGPFITLPVVHTKDPETGSRNVGMYRMQVFDNESTGMHWHPHKGSARHFMKYKDRNERMPVTVTLGGDPIYTYVATAPLPENLDEYVFAGFLRKKKVELVKCLTNDIHVPADVDFVLEGYIDPGEKLVREGPFGDHTGFYSLAGDFPLFHITCITHRRSAIYPSTIVGIPPMEDGWIGKATERIFLSLLRNTMMPELVDMDMPVEGVFHNLALVSVEKTYPGQGLKAMNTLWGAGQMMFNKVMVILDKDINIHHYTEVAKSVSENADPLLDINFIKGVTDILDHSSRQYAFGSKIGIDATNKLPSERLKYQETNEIQFVDHAYLNRVFPEIDKVNDTLAKQAISFLIIAVKKSRQGQLKEMSLKAIEQKAIRGFKFIIFLDSTVDIFNLHDVVWVCGNNIDPMRDCFFCKMNGADYPALFIDATRKTQEADQFDREWPNVIVMDDETIMKIDKKWLKLGLGDFLPSPSLNYKSLVINNNPSAKQNGSFS
jgi:4-hydroxy-3-polyprenylbenzoate decarboxylase